MQKKSSESIPKIFRGDLQRVYVDPIIGPRDVPCWIPEQHASANCERALKGGSRVAADPRGAWCDMCTTPKTEEATIRRTLTGRWKAA